MFWKTRARYQPGKLVGAFLLVYGLSRFLVEFVREADAHLVGFAQTTGLHMGQWLSLPMIIAGLYPDPDRKPPRRAGASGSGGARVRRRRPGR